MLGHVPSSYCIMYMCNINHEHESFSMHMHVHVGVVLQEVLSHLKRTRFPVDLGSLARVEEMIVDKFGSPNFESLGNGSFLGFVASHDPACEALGGRLIGTNSSSSHIAAVKKKVMNIIQQLKFDKRDDQVCCVCVCVCVCEQELDAFNLTTRYHNIILHNHFTLFFSVMYMIQCCSFLNIFIDIILCITFSHRILYLPV